MSKAHRNPLWTALAKDVVMRAQLDDQPCCRCGQPINYAAPRNSKYGATADHLDPLALGGKLLSDHIAVAHRVCNSRHGGSIGGRMRAAKGWGKPKTSSPTPWPERPTRTPKVEPTFEGLEEAEDESVCGQCGGAFGGKARGWDAPVIDREGLAHRRCAPTLDT